MASFAILFLARVRTLNITLHDARIANSKERVKHRVGCRIDMAKRRCDQLPTEWKELLCSMSLQLAAGP